MDKTLCVIAVHSGDNFSIRSTCSNIKYLKEMRKRMDVLMSAYLGDDVEYLRKLRDEEGVTHLLVNKDHFMGIKPRYFKPWDEEIKNIYSKKIQNFAIPDLVDTLKSFEDGNLVLLDLALL